MRKRRSTACSSSISQTLDLDWQMLAACAAGVADKNCLASAGVDCSMESCSPLLAALRSDAVQQEWAGACARLKAAFDDLPAGDKAVLVASDDCVPVLLRVITRESDASCGDDGSRAALHGSCEALNALFKDLPTGTKQSLLSGEKGVVDALLRVLANENCKIAWGSVGFCFRNLFLNVNAEVRQQLIIDSRGIVEAIVGVLESDEVTAWEGACGAVRACLFQLCVSVKESLLSGEKGVVRALLRVLGDTKGKAAWEHACRCFWSMFTGSSSDCREALLSDGRGIVEAIVGVLDSEEAAAWAGAVGALINLLSDLSVSAKQSLLSGEKGVVRALLRILGDTKGKAYWDDACRCFGNMFSGSSSDCREALLSDGRGIVQAIFGVLDSEEAAAREIAGYALSVLLSDLSVSAKQLLLSGENGIAARIFRILGDANHGAWGSACIFLSALLADLPPSAMSLFLLSHPQLVSTIVSCLEHDESHRYWGGAVELLKRLVFQESSLSHIDLRTLDFLRNDCGLMAVLLRYSQGRSSDAVDDALYSASKALLHLSSASSTPYVAVSCEILTLAVSASRHCSHDSKELEMLLNVMSNFSENVAHCPVLAQAKCHEFALSNIARASTADVSSVTTHSLSIIVNMSRNETLHAELKQGRVIEILARFADDTCALQLRVLMAMSYIIGCKEITAPSGSGVASALSQLANSSSIGKIVDCLENTLNLKGGPGYSFGSVVLPAILQV
jgi:hypothetical protein